MAFNAVSSAFILNQAEQNVKNISASDWKVKRFRLLLVCKKKKKHFEKM